MTFCQLLKNLSLLGDEHTDLIHRLVILGQKTGIQVKEVFTFDMSRRTKSANAALTGIGNTRRIILGDTLLAVYSTDEIETVLAHEIGHHATMISRCGLWLNHWWLWLAYLTQVRS